MEFDVSAVPIQDLLGELGQGFFIPEYQRGFSWGKDDVEKLLFSFSAGIESAANDGGHTPFLGTCIFVNDKSGIQVGGKLPTSVCQVIDGQQRLSTLTIICAELGKSILGECDGLSVEATNFLEERASELEHVCLVGITSGRSAELVPRIMRSGDKWGTAIGECALASGLSQYVAERVLDHTVNPSSWREDASLAAAVDGAKSEIRQMGEGKGAGEQLAEIIWSENLELLGLDHCDEALRDAILQNQKLCRFLAIANHIQLEVKVIRVVAKDISGALSLFGPLNSTGQSLTAIELLKPSYVKLRGVNFNESEVAGAFSDILNFLKHDDPAKRDSMTRAFVVLGILCESGSKVGEDLEEQRRFLNRHFELLEGVDGKEELVFELRDLSQFLKSEWSSPESSIRLRGNEMARVSFELLRPKHTIVAPILSRYCHALQDDSEYEGVVRATAAFSTLWRLYKGGTAGIDAEYRRLLKSGCIDSNDGSQILSPISRVASESPNGSPPSVDQYIKALRVRFEECCTDSEDNWAEQVSRRDLYSRNRVFTRFGLLAAYHDSIQDSQGEFLLCQGAEGSASALTLGSWKAYDSVEHIAPQSRGIEGYDPQIYEQAMVHSLGNLTVLPFALNQNVSNRIWANKRDLFSALGCNDATQRLTKIQDMDCGLSRQATDHVISASCLVGVASLGNGNATDFHLDDVVRRGDRLARLVYRRLMSWLE